MSGAFLATLLLTAAIYVFDSAYPILGLLGLLVLTIPRGKRGGRA